MEKKVGAEPLARRQAWLERAAAGLPVSRQCELLGSARSTVYDHPGAPPVFDKVRKRRWDELYTAPPF